MSSISTFVVFSPKPVIEIEEWILDEAKSIGLNESSVGSLRVDTYHGKETNRTICLFDRKIYDKMVEDGYGHGDEKSRDKDFSVAVYELKNFLYPKEFETRELFVSIPFEIAPQSCADQLNELMHEIVKFGILSKIDDYWIRIPVYRSSRDSRKTDLQHKKACFIFFKDSVTEDQIANVRAIIHDSVLCVKNEYPTITCYYITNDKDLTDVRNSDKVLCEKPPRKEFVKTEGELKEEFNETRKEKKRSKKQKKNKKSPNPTLNNDHVPIQTQYPVENAWKQKSKKDISSNHSSSPQLPKSIPVEQIPQVSTNHEQFEKEIPKPNIPQQQVHQQQVHQQKPFSNNSGFPQMNSPALPIVFNPQMFSPQSSMNQQPVAWIPITNPNDLQRFFGIGKNDEKKKKEEKVLYEQKFNKDGSVKFVPVSKRSKQPIPNIPNSNKFVSATPFQGSSDWQNQNSLVDPKFVQPNSKDF